MEQSHSDWIGTHFAEQCSEGMATAEQTPDPVPFQTNKINNTVLFVPRPPLHHLNHTLNDNGSSAA